MRTPVTNDGWVLIVLLVVLLAMWFFIATGIFYWIGWLK